MPFRDNLARRAGAAAVLVPLTLGAAWSGGPAFTVLVAVAAALVVVEWTRLTARGAHRAVTAAAVAAVIAAMVAFEWAGPVAGFVTAGVGAGAAAGVALALGAAPGWIGLGVVYAGLTALALAGLRADAGFGLAAVVWLFAAVWVGDTAAFVAGNLIGGPKLAPSISPAKTWSGALAALAGALAVGLVCATVLRDTSPAMLALVSVGVGIAAILGDLFESRLKRRFGAKNTGDLIPGHGGMMDRVDSLVAAALFAAAIGFARGGIEGAGKGVLIW